LDECLFKYSDEAVGVTDSEFEPKEDSSEAKIAGTPSQIEIVRSFEDNVANILKTNATTNATRRGQNRGALEY